jgi:zinc and cadmium transporter
LAALLLVGYCLLITLASVAGGYLPARVLLTHLRMQLMMSLVSGLMLGVALLHLLPHAIEYSPSISLATGCMLTGLLAMFFVLRMFHVHYHDELLEEPPCPAEEAAESAATTAAGTAASAGGRHQAEGDLSRDLTGHPPQAHHHDHHHHQSAHRLSWVGLFVGLAVHSLLDGVALAASVVAEGGHGGSEWRLLGFGTFLAVLTHKPLDSLSITALMGAAGWSLRGQTAINLSFALACPLGAFLFWFGVGHFVDSYQVTVGCALAFSAGVFLCLALSDLLPEVAFHSHDRLKLSVALLLGVLIALGIELLHAGVHEVHPHEQLHQHEAHHL